MDKQKNAGMQQKEKAKNSVLASTMTFKDLGIKKVDEPFCDVGYSIWVRALMQNWRQGTVACKGRSDVSFSNIKPWKQKGTGRARAGSRRSPLWRSGGVTFGPQPRVKQLRVSKRTKQKVLRDILVSFLKNKKITSLDWGLKADKPKTSEAYKVIKDAGINTDKIVLFLKPDDFLTLASFANIPNVNIIFFDQANAFDLSNCTRWVFLKKDLDSFKEMVSIWI